MLKLVSALSFVAVLVCGCSTGSMTPAKAENTPASSSAAKPAYSLAAWSALVDDADKVKAGCDTEYGDVALIDAAKAALEKQGALSSDLGGFLENAEEDDAKGNDAVAAVAAELKSATQVTRVACQKLADDVKASRGAVQD